MISPSSPIAIEDDAAPPPGARPDGLPADWVDHPKIPITRRAILVGIGLVALGTLGAVTSIWARRTQVEKTTAFFGIETIRALQYAPGVMLRLEAEAADAPLTLTESESGRSATSLAGSTPPTVVKEIDLTATPGLGHLRHALLDERHYDWTTRNDRSIDSLRSPRTRMATLTFSDPRGIIAPATIHLELTEGWVGTPRGDRSVRLIPRVQPAIRHFLVVISNAQQTYYDRRQQEKQD